LALVTTTLKEQELVLPLPSPAVQVTVFVPTAKLLPPAGTHVTGTAPAQVSEALTLKVTGVLLELMHTAMSLAQLITGLVVSTTFTVRVAVCTLPLGSVAV
jgi:hypothetical protein